jgi:hypothetical protein
MSPMSGVMRTVSGGRRSRIARPTLWKIHRQCGKIFEENGYRRRKGKAGDVILRYSLPTAANATRIAKKISSFLPLTAPETRLVVITYYDTFDFRLLAAGRVFIESDAPGRVRSRKKQMSVPTRLNRRTQRGR